MKRTPNAGSLQAGCLLLLSASSLLSVTKELVKLLKLGLAVFATTFTQAPNLIIAKIVI